MVLVEERNEQAHRPLAKDNLAMDPVLSALSQKSADRMLSRKNSAVESGHSVIAYSKDTVNSINMDVPKLRITGKEVRNETNLRNDIEDLRNRHFTSVTDMQSVIDKKVASELNNSKAIVNTEEKVSFLNVPRSHSTEAN